ncbi:hypothetical protein [Paenibacillus plantarum]|uniref:hypothetical protein n=1 Tax=Paenibacillus plantarum TaxID=2654975 RepID=UPI001492F4BD|nr:hypothetical protein [Paenibacillus plantarum]
MLKLQPFKEATPLEWFYFIYGGCEKSKFWSEMSYYWNLPGKIIKYNEKASWKALSYLG